MNYLSKMSLLLYLNILFFSCSSSSINETKTGQIIINNGEAKIVSVTTSGNENKYNFSVGVSSPDKGCDQYANWWEVISEEGELIYRRILAHSHVNEQPFIRSGGEVQINKDQIVIIRVHMNTLGYSSIAYRGSVSNGFNKFNTEDNFAADLANQEPLPSGCAF